ncbi:MAG: hypothetical protein J0M00_02725 [Burkholderiales bacterium]|nr:hypothetical protein [Burkholderiales bacterium]
MTEVRALLDRPDPKSFGLVPIVRGDGRGNLCVSGLSEESSRRARGMDEPALGELIRNGSALPVNFDLPEDTPANAAALWVGDEFANETEHVQTSLPPLPVRTLRLDGGQVAIGSPDEMFVYLDQWVSIAFDRFKSAADGRRRQRLVSLMQWALPSDRRTLAASWQLAANPSAELDMQVRLFGRGHSVAEWRRSLNATLKTSSNPLGNVRVVVFTGPTGSMREEVFREFVERSRLLLPTVAAASFKKVVEQKARAVRPSGDPDKDLLMRVGQRVVESSPLFVATSIQELVDQHVATTLIVDSVRHRSVLNAVQWLVQADVMSIGVSAADEDVRQRIQEERYVEQVIHEDPTEIEIPELVRGASYKIDTSSGKDWRRAVDLVSRQVFA